MKISLYISLVKKKQEGVEMFKIKKRDYDRCAYHNEGRFTDYGTPLMKGERIRLFGYVYYWKDYE